MGRSASPVGGAGSVTGLGAITGGGSAIRVDPPFVDKEGARLRVVAQTDQAADYWFEFQPRPSAVTGQKVIIHESPSQPKAGFAF